MSNILTPVSLWKDFDDSLDTLPRSCGEKIEDGIKYEYVNFYGRETMKGRVLIYGIFATNFASPSRNALLIFNDSCNGMDESLIKFYVDNGYSVLMVDYCGKREGLERFTVYPEAVSYANYDECGRHKDYVDEDAKKTSWYEWVSVGIYARKYLLQKIYPQTIGLIGIRCGGEIAWKLASVVPFNCAVIVCACGWKAYSGYSKFGNEDPKLNDERYRFLAGIDSQSYAPYVKCPILMLCSTNDPDFDYDRAYDTFTRINPHFSDDSAIAFSVKSNACIGERSTIDMFMFLDKWVKQRQVFIPKPAEITIGVDDEDNLIAKTSFDDHGVAEKFSLFMAEDCKVSLLRDWVEAPYKQKISDIEHEFYLNVYEKTTMLFALCYVIYSNGFTVWSKIVVKKISGKFRNSQPKCNVMYSSKYGEDCFSISNKSIRSVGNTFLTSSDMMPKLVAKANDLKGIYSVCGLSTYRLNSPRYAPDKESILKFDVCPDENMALDLKLTDMKSGEVFIDKVNVVGGVWQSIILSSKHFKNSNGLPLEDYTRSLNLSIDGKGAYAVNNVLWL